jgi:hypothetical protein
MKTCRICGERVLGGWLDFGPQPIRNRLLDAPGEEDSAYSLAVGHCSSCGTVQLADPPPAAALRPRFGPVVYNEPERHLDEVADTLARLAGISPRSAFAGLTYKDDSTLARLNRLGFPATWRPDPGADLGIESPFAGIESVQETLTPAAAERLTERYGRPDVLLVRHVLEHTHNTPAALDWARGLVRPGGFVVFEVPDAARALDRLDYTTVWEEHVLYFTPGTLRGCLDRAGFEVVSLTSHPYTLEDSLVIVARPGDAPCRTPAGPADLALAGRFQRMFPRVRERIRNRLEGAGRVAVLGAGHHAGAFINLYGLADRVEFVVDDSPAKQGRYMPGSRLPILPSSALIEREVDVCLMTVRPEIEEAVVARNTAFTERGGVLASVFPGSPYSLDRLVRPAGVEG